MKKRLIPCNHTPDTPEVLVSAEVRGWDDMELMRALSVCPDSEEYLAELDRRRRFEGMWSGDYVADHADPEVVHFMPRKRRRGN